jgi:hypothetical protein
VRGGVQVDLTAAALVCASTDPLITIVTAISAMMARILDTSMGGGG